ncbi:MAG: glycine zipper 2TM domain-containing protein [Rhizobacter sp.]|nr:glycine zipper 2TM domain-containing protein [Rhizobacter sp.]
MFSIPGASVPRHAGAWFVAACVAGVFSAAALTACGPRDVPAAGAAAPATNLARAGNPVPPTPIPAPAPAVAPPSALAEPLPSPQVAAVQRAPQPGSYAASPAPRPVPPAIPDDLARPETAPVPTRDARVAQRQPAPPGARGAIERIDPITQRPQGNGTGAVIGGVAGALLGNQFGHGLGRAAMTGIGAAGGAVAGNNIERNVRKTVVGYRIHVRLDDGSMRTFERSQLGELHVGARVRVGRDGVHRV